jgi:exodeoxyribonuclease V alpha subunit
MDAKALQRLREQIRLKKLRSEVASIEGNIDEDVKRGEFEVNKLTQAIAALSPEPEDEDFADIPYNEAQTRFINLLVQGRPVALTGPAGSGKTTAVKGGIKKLLSEGKIPPINKTDHKWIHQGTPGVICTAFTNKAVENMKRVLPKDLRSNCMTIHKLLEFKPEYFDTLDEDTGLTKKTMNFLPSRHADNPLPTDIKVLMIDEATMTDVELWNKLADAITHPIQLVLIGDIQQLPPVFGKSIFIHAMQGGIEKVELTEVHRQALESPIISLAHRILSGKQIPPPELDSFNYNGEHGRLTIKPWKKALSDTGALKIMGMTLPQFIDAGEYDPMNDVILTCFNVNFGCIELNKIVANHLAVVERRKLAKLPFENEEKLEQTKKCAVHEIIAGIKKRYFRIGDKVLFNKTEHFIVDIQKNPKYFGKLPRMGSTTMDYNGIESDSAKAFEEDAGQLLDKTLDDIDDFLNSFSSMDSDKDEGMPRAASHVLKLYSESLDTEVELTSGSEIGNLELGYAITVHKSQGSEYPRVFFISHSTQATMHFRELLYTAMTRAKRELVVICPPSMFVKGINTQRLPGKTLEDKIASFDRTMQLQKGATAQQPMRMDLFKSSNLLNEVHLA